MKNSMAPTQNGEENTAHTRSKDRFFIALQSTITTNSRSSPPSLPYLIIEIEKLVHGTLLI
jgi:hypothetical protein